MFAGQASSTQVKAYSCIVGDYAIDRPGSSLLTSPRPATSLTSSDSTTIRSPNLTSSFSSTDTFPPNIDENMIRDFGILLSCHGIMNLALKRLHDLKRSTVKPFLDKWHTEIEFNRALSQGPHEQLMVFFQKLELRLAEIRQNIVIYSRRHQLHPDSTADLIHHTIPLFSWQSLCPVCFRLDDDDVLNELEKTRELPSCTLHIS